MRRLSWVLMVLLAAPPSLIAQQAGQASEAAVLKPEELEQVVAPIALHPDPLISQILMAATYPLEVVQAERWVKQNASLKGDALTKALEAQDWDPSIKSLVNFPQVLTMMSEKLDWTQKLGDAFLADQKKVLDTIQSLRAKAQAAGNLKTTKEQTVIVEEKIIKIEPASPQVIYVPTYNPTVVYGAWPYPAYPPYSYYPPGYVAGLRFGLPPASAWARHGVMRGAMPTGMAGMSISTIVGTPTSTTTSIAVSTQTIGRRAARASGSITPSTAKGFPIAIKGRRKNLTEPAPTMRSSRASSFAAEPNKAGRISAGAASAIAPVAEQVIVAARAN